MCCRIRVRLYKYWAQFYIIERLLEDVILGVNVLGEHRVLEQASDAFWALSENSVLPFSLQGILLPTNFEDKLRESVIRLKRECKVRPRSVVTTVDLAVQNDLEDQQENARREKEDLRVIATKESDDRTRTKQMELKRR
jgi:hypothetical protein